MRNAVLALNNMLAALKQDLPILCRKDRSWYVEGRGMTLLRNWLGLKNNRLLSVLYTLNDYFEILEKAPVRFYSSSLAPSGEDLDIDYRSLLEVTQKILNDLSPTTNEAAVSLIQSFKRKYIGLKYRLESINGGVDKHIQDNHLILTLAKTAADWKKKQDNFINKELLEQDQVQLNETSRYPLFVELLQEDTHLQNAFFEWILRDKNPVAAFIEFPCLQQKLVECALNGRISRYGGHTLKIQKVSKPEISYTEKVLMLPIEGKFRSLLDENLILTFRGNYSLSLKEIFEIFKDKMYHVGNLEFMAEGIINWNVHHLGWWDADKQKYIQVDLASNNWWNELPILEIISVAQTARRYHLPVNGWDWIVGAKATRGTPTLNYDQTHAFMELAIPTATHDAYRIYNFGKFSYKFPSSFFSCLSTFCLNMHATIAYPDENIFYTHRQEGCYPLLMTEQQGIKLMNALKEDTIKARNNNLVFQIESDNCAKWLYEKLVLIFGDKVPDFFRMSLMKTEPVGFVGICFAMMRNLEISEMTQFKLLTWIHVPFGAGKGTVINENGQTVVKSLKSHEFWKTSIVFLPALLIEKIHTGQLAFNQPIREELVVTQNVRFSQEPYALARNWEVKFSNSFYPTYVPVSPPLVQVATRSHYSFEVNR